MSALARRRAATLAVAVAGVVATATLWSTPADASDGLSIGSDGVRGMVFALDGRYLPMTTPPMPLLTHYPFASRMRSIGRLDGLDAAAAGVDVRVRFGRGWTIPIFGFVFANSGSDRTFMAPDGTNVGILGEQSFDFGLPGIGYHKSFGGFVAEATVRPTLSFAQATNVSVRGERGGFGGDASSALRFGVRGELDLCAPPAWLKLGELEGRVCALASPQAVAEGGGAAIAFGLRLEASIF